MSVTWGASTRGLRQEKQELKVSLVYTVKPCVGDQRGFQVIL